MSKIKDNNIEEIEKTAFNDITYYIITFRGEKIGRLFEESKLTKSEKQICENILLKRKRKNSDNIYSEKSKSTKKSKKINIKRKDDLEKSKSSKKQKKTNNKKDDDESYNNLTISSFSNIKTKSKKYKKEYNKENNNRYNNKNSSSEDDSDNISENKRKNEKISDSENKTESEMKQTKLFERQGILLEDTPKEILNVGYKNRNDKTLYSLVKWEQYKNIKILDSIVENKKIRQAFPQLLIDFYESRIMFLDE